MKRLRGVLISVGLLAFWGGVSPAMAGTVSCGVPLPEVVAKVGDRSITRGEIFLRLDPTRASGQSALSRCRAAVDEATHAALLGPVSEQYRLLVRPEEETDQMEAFRARFESDEAFQRFLADREADLGALTAVIHDRLLLIEFEKRQLNSWTFSDELQQEYFDRHRAELAHDRMKVAHILVTSREEALRILKERGVPPRSFAELAETYSIDEATRHSGGEMGWIERGTMPGAFDEAAFSLETGVISQPIQTRHGWHLLMVQDRLPASDQRLDDHRDRVIRLMQQEEWDRERASWWEERRTESDVWTAPEFESAAMAGHVEHP